MSNHPSEPDTDKLRELEELVATIPQEDLPDKFAEMFQRIELQRALLAAQEQIRELEQEASTPAIATARAEIIRALCELVPKAVADAKKGKPALLRLICRTIRLK